MLVAQFKTIRLLNACLLLLGHQRTTDSNALPLDSLSSTTNSFSNNCSVHVFDASHVLRVSGNSFQELN